MNRIRFSIDSYIHRHGANMQTSFKSHLTRSLYKNLPLMALQVIVIQVLILPFEYDGFTQPAF